LCGGRRQHDREHCTDRSHEDSAGVDENELALRPHELYGAFDDPSGRNSGIMRRRLDGHLS